MKKKLPGWNKINEYAQEYYTEVQKGFGTEVKYIQKDDTISIVDNRSSYQKELADKIITGTRPFLHRLAQELLNGKVEVYNQGPKLSLKKYRMSFIEDLVQEATLNMVKCLKNFQPAKGSISTFIHYNAIAAMCRYAKKENGFIKVPLHIIDKVEKYISNGRWESIYHIMEETSTEATTSAAVYCGITNKYKNINGLIETNHHFSNSPSQRKVEETIADENAQTDKKVQQQELETRIERVLATLTPREELVMRMRFGIGDDNDQSLEKIGEKLRITPQRIKQIEVKALQKLRHYSLSQYLKEFVD